MIKIIGIGSPFGNDQIGFKIVEQLKTSKKLKSHHSDQIDLIIADRPGLTLLQLMKDADAAILIDAVKSDAKPGTIHRFNKSELLNLEKNIFPSLSTHDIGLLETLQMGNELNLLPEHLIVYGIEISNDESCQKLPPSIENDILNLIEEYL